MLYDARKRDYLRSKLRPGLRLRAEVDAEQITNNHIQIQDHEDKILQKKVARSRYDNAMETAYLETRKDYSLKKITL